MNADRTTRTAAREFGHAERALLSAEEWNLETSRPEHALAFARLLARLYLLAPLEHEEELERLLGEACARAGVESADLVEQVGVAP